ncbi:thiamine phosphate synthase [Albirhodobacter sp. R86504]|uniref:thiamine phosphate synthase n=1 Tax=Albirhodobacter sp. R86504 TaxID=3093848 RepID=UPI00366FF4C6
MSFSRFYLITGDADLLERLVPLGVELVQLRAKGLSRAALRAEALRAQACCAAHGAQLVLNDDWELALELGIDFVHLGQEDLAGADIDALRRAGVRFGLSTHDEAELARAMSFEPAYIALGPIYPTLLKQMPWAPQGLDRITDWKARIGSTPLVAIGGLTPERAAGVWGAGAQSCAVVTDIVQAQSPEARCKTWLDTAAQEPAR